jgi:hypothetical protein
MSCPAPLAPQGVRNTCLPHDAQAWATSDTLASPIRHCTRWRRSLSATPPSSSRVRPPGPPVQLDATPNCVLPQPTPNCVLPQPKIKDRTLSAHTPAERPAASPIRHILPVPAASHPVPLSTCTPQPGLATPCAGRMCGDRKPPRSGEWPNCGPRSSGYSAGAARRHGGQPLLRAVVARRSRRGPAMCSARPFKVGCALRAAAQVFASGCTTTTPRGPGGAWCCTRRTTARWA